jgi:hypothetical protein
VRLQEEERRDGRTPTTPPTIPQVLPVLPLVSVLLAARVGRMRAVETEADPWAFVTVVKIVLVRSASGTGSASAQWDREQGEGRTDCRGRSRRGRSRARNWDGAGRGHGRRWRHGGDDTRRDARHYIMRAPSASIPTPLTTNPLLSSILLPNSCSSRPSLATAPPHTTTRQSILTWHNLTPSNRPQQSRPLPLPRTPALLPTTLTRLRARK